MLILAFPHQQPCNTLGKPPTDSKQNLRPNLYLAAFHHGEIVLADGPISVKPYPCRLTATRLFFPIYVQVGAAQLHRFRLSLARISKAVLG